LIVQEKRGFLLFFFSSRPWGRSPNGSIHAFPFFLSSPRFTSGGLAVEILEFLFLLLSSLELRLRRRGVRKIVFFFFSSFTELLSSTMASSLFVLVREMTYLYLPSPPSLSPPCDRPSLFSPPLPDERAHKEGNPIFR